MITAKELMDVLSRLDPNEEVRFEADVEGQSPQKIQHTAKVIDEFNNKYFEIKLRHS